MFYVMQMKRALTLFFIIFPFPVPFFIGMLAQNRVTSTCALTHSGTN